MKIAILSDIHANYGALAAVLDHAAATHGDDLRFLQLGDLVNYGPRPNEVVERIRALAAAGRLLVNLAGNHEAALDGRGLERFSSERGRATLRQTAAWLTPESAEFLRTGLSFEPVALAIEGRWVLCVHGSLADPFWGELRPPTTAAPAYRPYDVVFCGHTHRPVLWEEFFPDERSVRRGQKKTVFLNPGSIGQPRNHDVRAQYAVWDPAGDDGWQFHQVSYDVAAEQELFPAQVHEFYRQRLAAGV
jgi:predicted phosphodiesterase